MAPDRTKGEVYDRILPLDMASRWDFTKWTPDVVLINLSTNDFAKERPTEEEWTTAYAAFIHFPLQNMKADGLGAAYHPNIKTNQKNAKIFVDRLNADLKWEAAK